MWARIGAQACVPILGPHTDKRVLTGVLNIGTGAALFSASETYRQEDLQDLLPDIQAAWPGWRLVLFLDRHCAHTAELSQALADELGIELRWLPKACSELNVVDHLWRHLKGDVLANEPTPDLDATLQCAFEYLASLSPEELLCKAGVLSDDFWLKGVLGR